MTGRRRGRPLGEPGKELRSAQFYVVMCVFVTLWATFFPVAAVTIAVAGAVMMPRSAGRRGRLVILGFGLPALALLVAGLVG